MALKPQTLVTASPTQLLDWAKLVGRFGHLEDGVAVVAEILSGAARGEGRSVKLKDEHATVVAAVIGLCQDAAESIDTTELTFRKSAGRITSELPLDLRSV